MMEIDGKKIDTVQYRYELKIFPKGENEPIIHATDQTNKIARMLKDDNPILDKERPQISPVFKLLLRCNEEERKKLHKSRKSLVIQFSLYALYNHVGKGNMEENEKLKPLWDKKFDGMINDPEDNTIDPTDNENLAGTEKNTYTAASTASMQQVYEVEILLLLTEDRDRLKTIVNFNHSEQKGLDKNSTVANAVAAILTEMKPAPKSIIFQKPDRIEKFEQIMVPQNNVIQALRRLQTDYGIYKSGLFLYQDIDIFYILPVVAKEYAVREKEYQDIFIYLFDSNVLPVAFGTYTDDDHQHILITAKNRSQIHDTSDKLKELEGNNFKILGVNQEFSSLKTENDEFKWVDPWVEHKPDIKGNEASKDRVRMLVNSKSNDYIVTEHIQELNMSTILCQVTLENVDYSLFTFNKRYHLVFQDTPGNDKNHSGIYKMLRIQNNFMQKENEKLRCTANILFGRVDEETEDTELKTKK